MHTPPLSPPVIDCFPHLTAPRPERRSGTRYPTDEAAALVHINPVIPGKLAIRIKDVSANGMQLQVPEYIFPGSLLQIRFSHYAALAEVRHCRAEDGKFLTGVRILDLEAM